MKRMTYSLNKYGNWELC